MNGTRRVIGFIVSAGRTRVQSLSPGGETCRCGINRFMGLLKGIEATSRIGSISISSGRGMKQATGQNVDVVTL